MSLIKKYKRIVFDLESNGFLEDLLDFSSMPLKLNKEKAKLWCITFMDFENPEDYFTLDINHGYSKEMFKEIFSECEEIIFHNGVKFDSILLFLFGLLDYKIYTYADSKGNNGEVFGRPVKVTDTLILSKILDPDRFEGHSLESFGKRTGTLKLPYRSLCIEAGLIPPDSPKGYEFSQFFEPMIEYCVGDCTTSVATLSYLLEEQGDLDINFAYHMELKLADLIVKQEFYGFEFDTDLAYKNLEKLNNLLEERRQKVNPQLPPKTLNKGESKPYMPPVRQFKANGDISAFLSKFAERLGAEINEDKTVFTFEGRDYPLPLDPEICLKETLPADIEDLNHLKKYLIDLGWSVTEWNERDLTKASGSKTKLSKEKYEETVARYVKDTLTGLFKKERLELLGTSEDELEQFLLDQFDSYAVRVPTSPSLKVGTAKEVCPNLELLGIKAEFVKDVLEYLTYKHRRNSIAGGDPDPETGEHSKGFLASVSPNGRIRTPADTLGGVTGRFKHRMVANLPRPSSLFGSEIRSMFKAGKDRIEFGIDWSAVEARVQGHFCYIYENGPELAEMLVADKPNSIHSVPVYSKLLTKGKGWVRVDEITYQDQIAQWDNGIITFVNPTNIILRKSDSDLYTFTYKDFKMITTDLHRVLLFNNNTLEYETMLAKDVPQSNSYSIPLSGNLKGDLSLNPSQSLISLLWNIFSSGFFNKNQNIVIHSSTLLNSKYLTEKLEFLGFKYHKFKDLSKTFNEENSEEVLFEILEENFYENIVSLYLDKDFNFKPYLLSLSQSSRYSFLSIFKTALRGELPLFKKELIETLLSTLEALHDKGEMSERLDKFQITNEYSEEMVGCVSVPSSYILVKQEDNIFVSGNCLSSDTEILTESGWRNKETVTMETSVAQWNKKSRAISFVKPLGYVRRFLLKGESMIHIQGERIDILVSQEHRMVVFNPETLEFEDVLAKDLQNFIEKHPKSFIPASGTNVVEDTLDYVVDYFIGEKPHYFDSIVEKEMGYVVSSKDLSVIEEVQEELLLNDCISLIHTKIINNKEKIFQTLIPKKASNLKGLYLKHTTITEIKHGYDKEVWCVEVPEGYIVTRRNGKVAVLGNCVNSRRMGITRDEAKTFGYAILYGAGPPKLAKTLGISLEEAEALFKSYWDGLPGMVQLRERVEKFWEKTGKDYILGIDGRHLKSRSKHSLLNLLFQSAGALLVKYVIVDVCGQLEDLGLLGDPFLHSGEDERIYLMIVYHDEYQLSCPESMFTIHKFKTEEEAQNFRKVSKSGSYSFVDGEYWIGEENILSSLFDQSVDAISQIFKLRTHFGVEWQLGRSWSDAH